MQSIGDGCNLVSSSFSSSPLLTLQPLEGLPDTLNLQLSHFPAQKSSMAPMARCNKYQLPRLAVKALQEGDPAHLSSLVSHCSPPGQLCSSQTAVLRALAAPSIPTCKPFSYSASLRTTFSLSVFQNITHLPKASSHTASSRYPAPQINCPSPNFASMLMAHTSISSPCIFAKQPHRVERVWALELREVCVQVCDILSRADTSPL